MSIRILSRVLEMSCVSPCTKAVLMYLAFVSNKKGECSPSILDICKNTSLSKSTVLRSLEFLRENKVLSVFKQTSNLKILNNLYKFNMSSGVMVTPLPDEGEKRTNGKHKDHIGVRRNDGEWCHGDTTNSGEETRTLGGASVMVTPLNNTNNPKLVNKPPDLSILGEIFTPHYSIARAPAFWFLNISNNIPFVNYKFNPPPIGLKYIKNMYFNPKYPPSFFDTQNGSKISGCKRCDGEMSSKPHPIAIQAIEYFNEVTGKNLRPKSPSTFRFLNGRIAEGTTLDELKAVIDWKYKHWKGTAQWVYMRPKTLFCETNFTNYLCEISNPGELEKKKSLSERVIDKIKEEDNNENEHEDGW